MGKVKYTKEIVEKVIELRIGGKSSTEITAETGMGKESQNKLFRKMGIKLTEEQAAETRARRWLDHEPSVDGKKSCSQCGENKPLDDFHHDAKRLSGRTSACKVCTNVFYEENKEVLKQRIKEYRELNPDLVRQWARDQYSKDKKDK